MPAISAIPTADLCDKYAAEAEVQIARPMFQDFGGAAIFAGEIATVRCRDDNSKVRDMLEQDGGGKVLVVDGGGSLYAALLGGNLATMAHDNNWCGIVVHGCVRDCEELKQTPIGVKALAAVPRRSEKRQTGEINAPVCFADIVFTPGDILYADSDGIVVSGRPL